MSEIQEHGEASSALRFGPLGNALLVLSKWLSVAGAVVFIGLVLMSIVSIVGRKLASSPVPGDVEILQLCASFATATFFAYCHLVGGDVKVDFFTVNAKPRVRHGMDAFGSLLVAVFGFVVAWCTALSALSVKAAGETTMILGWPLWVGQALIVPGLVLLGLSGLYMAALHVRACCLEVSQ